MRRSRRWWAQDTKFGRPWDTARRAEIRLKPRRGEFQLDSKASKGSTDMSNLPRLGNFALIGWFAIVVMPGPALAAPAGSVARTVGGIGMTGAGFGLIGATEAYGAAHDDGTGSVFLGSAAVVTLIAGLPTMVVGIGELAQQPTLGGDAQARAAWGRMVSGAVLGPTYLIVGGMASGFSLGLATAMCADGTYRSPNSLPLIAVSTALYVGSFPMIVHGDVAIDLARDGGIRTKLQPGKLLATSITISAIFAVAHISVAVGTLIREANDLTAELGQALAGAFVGGLMYTGSAIGFAAALKNRQNHLDAARARSSRASRGARLHGVSPFHDPKTGTTGVRLVGSW